MTDNEKIVVDFVDNCKRLNFPTVLIMDEIDTGTIFFNGRKSFIYRLFNAGIHQFAQEAKIPAHELLIRMAVFSAVDENNGNTSDALDLLTTNIAKYLDDAEKTWGNQS